MHRERVSHFPRDDTVLIRELAQRDGDRCTLRSLRPAETIDRTIKSVHRIIAQIRDALAFI